MMLMKMTAPTGDSPEALVAAQEALLQARSKYKLRNDAVELIMMANPVLKAVHGGTNASPIERYGSCLVLPLFFFSCLLY